MDLLRFMTAGNVDDGKSTLVGRMFYEYGKIPKDLWESIRRSSENRGNESPNLAFFTDGLMEEREKGITIDAAFRYFSTERRKFILADSPGHLEFLPNMVTAATQADAAVVLVDATRGISTQTRRHAWITQWLGIRDLFFAVNKIDAIGFSEKKFLDIKQDLEAWVLSSGFGSRATIAPISALLGDNLITRSKKTPWYTGPVLDEWLHAVAPPSSLDDGNPFRFPIQLKRTVDGQEELLGTAISGIVNAGMRVKSARGDREWSVERIFSFTDELQSARSGIPLRVQIGSSELKRGDVLIDATQPLERARKWQVEFCAFTSVQLKSDVFHSFLGTFRTKSKLVSLDSVFDPEAQVWNPFSGEKIPAATLGRGVLEFDEPVSSDPHGTFPGAGRMVLVRSDDHKTACAVLLNSPVQG